jgi:hypothetical protein
MIEIDLRVPDHDGRYETAATLRVQDGQFHITGRAELFDTRVPALDRRSGRPVRFDQDPEAWARNLDTTYRAGDLVPVVVRDSHPNPPPRRAPRPAVRVPDVKLEA